MVAVVDFAEIALLEEEVVFLLAVEIIFVQDVLDEILTFLDASRATIVVTAVGGQLLVVLVLTTGSACVPFEGRRSYLVMNDVTALAVEVTVPAVILSVTDTIFVGTVSIMLVTSCVEVWLTTFVTVVVESRRRDE
jgi:hypothetical protein